MFNPIKTIKNKIQQLLDWLRPKAKTAIQIVDFIKGIVESNAAAAVVKFTPTSYDDYILGQARLWLPKIATQLQVTGMILDHSTPDSLIVSLAEWLKKQNKGAQAMFYVAAAAKLTEIFADGKATYAEATQFSQWLFEEQKKMASIS